MLQVSFTVTLIVLLFGVYGENQFSEEQEAEGALVRSNPPSGEFGCGSSLQKWVAPLLNSPILIWFIS